MANVVDLGFRDNMPVRFGSDFNDGDACVGGFNKTYCQPVQEGDETKFQVTVDDRIAEQVPVQGDWTVLLTNWTANADGSITHAAGAADSAELNAFVTSGDIHRFKFTVSGRSAGSISLQIGDQSIEYDANQSEIFIIDVSSANVFVNATTSFDGTVTFTSISNINDFNYTSTDLIINGDFATDTDWGKDADWTIALGVATKAAGAGVSSIGQSDILNGVGTNVNIHRNKIYKMTFTISNYVAGEVFAFGGTQALRNYGVERIGNGTFTDYFVFREGNPLADAAVGLQASATGDFDLDNVSMVQLANDQYRIEDCDGNEIETIPESMISRPTDEITNVCLDWETLSIPFDECYKICADEWDGSAFIEVSCSECFCYQETQPCTILFTFTNDENIGPATAPVFDYEAESFTNQQRLFARLINPKYPIELNNNKSTIGSYQTLFGSQEKNPLLVFDDAPEYVHDWIAFMLIHDTWFMDAIQHVLEEEDYEPIWRSDRGVLLLSKSRVEVKKASQPNINYNC